VVRASPGRRFTLSRPIRVITSARGDTLRPSCRKLPGEEIFNFCRPEQVVFDERMETFRQAANGMIRRIWEKSNGCSFKVLRARVLDRPVLPRLGWVKGLQQKAKETALSTKTPPLI
jgi:hypothetical protein